MVSAKGKPRCGDIDVPGTKGVLSTAKNLSAESYRLTSEFVDSLNDNNADPKVIQRVVGNSWLMTEEHYRVWVSDMSRNYLLVSNMLQFDHRAGTYELVSLIQGLPSLRRRLPDLKASEEASLLLASFALLRSSKKLQQTYFYFGLDVINLKEESLAKVFRSIQQSNWNSAVGKLTRMAEDATNVLRVVEIEAALNASLAGSLAEGAL